MVSASESDLLSPKKPRENTEGRMHLSWVTVCQQRKAIEFIRPCCKGLVGCKPKVCLANATGTTRTVLQDLC